MAPLLKNEPIKGFICLGCYVFSQNTNEISHHDGTCSNCGEFFIMPVVVTPPEIEE